MFHDAENLTQYPHNQADKGRPVGSVDIVDDLRRAKSLLAELQLVGVVLSIDGDHLAFDAPVGAITDDLLGRMRTDRDGLLELLRSRCGDAVDVSIDVSPRNEPELIGLGPGWRCPWCCRGDRLADDADGWRCLRCDRLAWRWDADSFVRCDWTKPLLFAVPERLETGKFAAEPDPQKSRAPVVKHAGRSLFGEAH